MKTTESNTANEIRALSNEDLDAVAGGLVPYHGGGGGGKVIGGGYTQEPVLVSLTYAGSFLIFGPLFGGF